MAKGKKKRPAYTILIAQDDAHKYDELLAAAELGAANHGSKRNFVRVCCEESPTFREYAAKARFMLPLPNPPARNGHQAKKRRAQ